MTFIISRARILNEIPIRLAADKLEQVGLAFSSGLVNIGIWFGNLNINQHQVRRRPKIKKN